MNTIQMLLSNPIIVAAGYIVGFIGTFATIRSIKNKKPLWAIKTANLIKAKHMPFDKLMITYGGKKYENLSISRILFWNDGRESISGTDVSKENPLKIISSSDAIEILECSILICNGEQVKIDKDYEISFSFLNNGKGAVIQVLHTGVSSRDIKVIGDIRNGKPARRKYNIYENHLHTMPFGKRIENKLSIKLRERINFTIQKIQAIWYIFIGTILIFLSMFGFVSNKPKNWTGIVLLGVIAFLSLVLISVGVMTWKRTVPSGLEMFGEELGE